MSENNIDFSNGLNMPYSMEAEQAVLGSVLIDPSCLTNIVEYLKPECFFIPQHKELYAANPPRHPFCGRRGVMQRRVSSKYH